MRRTSRGWASRSRLCCGPTRGSSTSTSVTGTSSSRSRSARSSSSRSRRSSTGRRRARLPPHGREPGEALPEIAESGGDSVTFHVEAGDDLPGVVSRRLGSSGSASASPSTRRRPDEVAAGAARGRRSRPLHEHPPGVLGAAVHAGAVPRIRRLRERCQGTRSRSTAESAENTRRGPRAGANLLVAGTSVFGRTTSPRPTGGSPSSCA